MARDQIDVGERTAVNLRGVSMEEITRGDVLAQTGTVAASRCMDVQLTLLPGQTLKHMQKIRVLIGTANDVAQVRIVSGSDGTFAQLRLGRAICGYAGQRAVLRRLSPAATLGGAIILDPQAQPARGGDPNRLALLAGCVADDTTQIAKALAHAGRNVAKLADVARLSRCLPHDARARLGADFTDIPGGMLVLNSDLEHAQTDVLQRLSSYHASFPLHPCAPRSTAISPLLATELRQHIETSLLSTGQIRLHGPGLARTDHNPFTAMSDGQRGRMAALEAAFQDAGLVPLTLPQDTDARDLITLLESTGRLIRLQNVSLKQTLVFHASAVQDAAAMLRNAFPPPHSFTTGQAREALGTSRKVIVPLLEYFDSAAVTLRGGNTRHMRG
jgi:selenocysteine-specific elongation factor